LTLDMRRRAQNSGRQATVTFARSHHGLIQRARREIWHAVEAGEMHVHVF
jgi:hypothetical protein